MRIPINAQRVYSLNSTRTANTLGINLNLHMRRAPPGTPGAPIHETGP